MSDGNVDYLSDADLEALEGAQDSTTPPKPATDDTQRDDAAGEPASPSTPNDATPPADGSVKKDATPDFQKMFLDTKKAFTKSQMELANLKGQLEVLKTQSVAHPETPKVDTDWLEDVDWEAVRADPSLVKDMVVNLRNEIADVLRARDSYMEAKLQSADPEIVTYRNKIAELRLDPDYQAFSDKQLAVLARKLSNSTEPAAPNKPKGSVGGGSRPVAGPTDIKDTPLFKKIYGEQFVSGGKK